MILDENTRTELVDRLKKRGLPEWRAILIVNSFYEAAMNGLKEGETLPFFNEEHFCFLKKKNQIEIRPKSTFTARRAVLTT